MIFFCSDGCVSQVRNQLPANGDIFPNGASGLGMHDLGGLPGSHALACTPVSLSPSTAPADAWLGVAHAHDVESCANASQSMTYLTCSTLSIG